MQGVLNKLLNGAGRPPHGHGCMHDWMHELQSTGRVELPTDKIFSGAMVVVGIVVAVVDPQFHEHFLQSKGGAWKMLAGANNAMAGGRTMIPVPANVQGSVEDLMAFLTSAHQMFTSPGHGQVPPRG